MILRIAAISSIVLAPVAFSPSSEEVATTQCEQTLHFFLLTEVSPVLWIGEDIEGDCYGSWLHTLSFESGHAHFVSMLTQHFAEWEWIEAAKDNLRVEPVVQLLKSESLWQAEGEEWMIGLPGEESELLTSFQAYLEGGRGARTWTQVDETSRIVPPTFHDTAAELVFAYDRGLYVNYNVAAAFYFPEAEWLLVITEQELLDIGHDTMHGFLVYRLVSES